jgi:hypothetical protein
MFLFPNFDNNPWIEKYNVLVKEIKSNEAYYKQVKEGQPKRNDKTHSGWTADQVGIHHIIPKKVDMGLVKNKDNLLYIPFDLHCTLHYYLWKADPKYAPHLWFICIAGRKMGIWDLPGGEEEYNQLKLDVAAYKKSKNNKNKRK